MNGNKLFAASIAILALALGFFLGTLKGGCCCSGMGMSCCKKGAPCEHSAMNAPCDCTKGLPCSCEKNGQPCHCPNCAKHGHKGPHEGPHGDFNKGPKFKGPNFEVIDSLLQVTPEQKAAIEESRVKGDSNTKPKRLWAKLLKAGMLQALTPPRQKYLKQTRLCWNTALTGWPHLAKS